ncbi:MAG: Zn-dependent protease [Candidatus Azotimanducaceae bacterium]|jgi:Zn-dependent protease
MEQVIIIIALIMSIVLHEMAHGYMANYLGDPTARLQGRLSGNPLVHIDPLGSVIVPALLLLSPGNFLFGWAKPVPYNPYNLNDQKYGEAKVAAAGPAVNILLAIIFGLLIRAAAILGLPTAFLEIASYIVFINLLLAFFNMIPFPPLDGSKVIVAFLPFSAAQKYRELTRTVERYGIFVLFILIFILIQFLWPYLFGAVVSSASFITGLSASEFLSLIAF